MLKRMLRWLGIIVALTAGACFVAYARRALHGAHLSALLESRVLLAAATLIILYTVSILTTVVAWERLLHSMHQPAPLKRLLPILATTQFGKYLPGNVAQHIGRIALTRAAGISTTVALFSVAYELLLAMVAGAHISALTLLWELPGQLQQWRIVQYRSLLLAGVTLGAVAMLFLAPRVVGWISRLRADQRAGPTLSSTKLHLDVSAVFSCYMFYACGFIMIGVGLWMVGSALGNGLESVPGPAFFVGAFASSWLLGFIVPGAPAGLGIREMVLTAWLSAAMAPENAVLLVVTLRIATTAGDLINFIWGSVMMFKHRGAVGP